jgi:protease-4
MLINLGYLLRNIRRRLRRRVDYVYLEISGTLPEYADPPSLPQRLLGMTRPTNLHSLRRQLHRIAADPRTRGVVLVVRDFMPGWSTAESLRHELHTFRKQGKRIVAYLPGGDTRSYLVACAADEVLMPETAYLNLLGLHIEALFLRDALKMVGIDAEVTTVSPYKSAGDIFTRSDISPESREQLNRLLDQQYDLLVSALAADRSLSPQRVKALIDGAPYSAKDALKAGLIDDTCYEDELETRLAHQAYYQGNAARKQQQQRGIQLLNWQAATRTLRIPYRRYQKRLIGVVRIEGAIMAGESRNLPLPLPLLGGAQAGSDSVARALRQVEQDERIAALVLYVDSPGGDAFASDLIWREVLRVRRKKPVVVSMGNVAASGGYYVAAGASAIIAHQSTLTGSIGVVSLRPIAARLLERSGIHTTRFNRGARAGLLNVTQQPTDDDRAVLQKVIADLYTDFKQRVCSGRGICEEALEAVAGGRVWTGREAHQHGLVDELGGLPDAIAKAQTLAELSPDPDAPVLWITPGKRRSYALPTPFPTDERLLKQVLRPRVLVLLPWVLSEG